MPRRPSSIKKLPDDLVQEIDRLLKAGKLTLVQITEYVRSAGGEVSKSALHRYSQELGKVSEAMDLGVAIAQRLGRDLDDTAQLSAGAAIGLETLIIRGIMKMQQGDEEDNAGLVELTTSLRNTAQARKANVDTDIKQRARFAKEAAAAATTECKKLGLTTETVDVIRSAILGIAARPA